MRLPLRLILTEVPHHSPIDGVWWPQTRNLAVEVADLIDHFPPYSGRVGRILYSRPDWDQPRDAHLIPAAWPRYVNARRGRVKVGSFPLDDTHLIQLVLSQHWEQRLSIMVVPSRLSVASGTHLMVQASDPGNRREAGDLLMQTLADEPRPSSRARRGRDDLGAWDDDGGSR